MQIKKSSTPLAKILVFKKNPSNIRVNPFLLKSRALFPMSEVPLDKGTSVADQRPDVEHYPGADPGVMGHHGTVVQGRGPQKSWGSGSGAPRKIFIGPCPLLLLKT